MRVFGSLRTKILVTTFLGFCLFLLAITLIFNKVFADFYLERLVESSNAVIEQYNAGFNEYVNRLRQLSYSVQMQENVSKIVQAPTADDTLSSLQDEAYIGRFFQTLLISNSEIRGIALILKDGRSFHNSIGFGEFGYDFSYSFWNGRFADYSVGDVAFFKDAGQRQYFTVIREIRAFPGSHLGYMVLLLDPGRSFSIIGGNNNGSIKIIVLDKMGNTIFSDYADDDETYLLLTSDMDGYLENMDNGDHRLIFHGESELTDCTIVAVVELYQMEQMYQFISNIRITMMLTTLLVSAVIAFFVSRSFLKDINKLTNRLSLIGAGSPDVSFDYKQTKETKAICEAIERMLGEIDTMNGEKLAAALRYEKLLVENAKAELYTLQSQMNPHFLCNALDAIRHKTLKNNDEEVYRLISLVAQFLRDSLDLKHDTARISAEIALVEHYLKIQRLRFSDRISYEINIDPKISDISILRFILQPLVENALIHGLEPCPDPCSVTIDGRQIEGWIVFTISDTGIGIPAQKLDELSGVIASETGSETNHIGISNTARRLSLFYGEAAKLTIESVEGQGTTVTLRLPAPTEAPEKESPEDT